VGRQGAVPAHHAPDPQFWSLIGTLTRRDLAASARCLAPAGVAEIALCGRVAAKRSVAARPPRRDRGLSRTMILVV
jgi:hypothetical protein